MIERYQGRLYRALNPFHAREPLSGRGAELHGGRFNPKGIPAIHTSLSVMTALREANQVGSCDADIERIFDGRDSAELGKAGMDAATLADPSWRDQMKLDGSAPTQRFSRELIAFEYHGLLVRSFAAGNSADDLNLVLWRWGAEPPHRLKLIDDEGRLSR